MRFGFKAILPVVVLVSTGAALGEGERERVEDNLNALGSVTDTFTDDVVEDVVVPFETNDPDETDLNHTQFEDEVILLRNDDSEQGRVLRATEDSAVVRPDIDIDGQGPLMDDANWAHENAEDVAGQYFSSETGTCEEIDIPVSTPIDMFCESLPARETKTCDLIRNIWVDRTDTYRCDRRAPNFVRVCTKNTAYVCNPGPNPASCIAANVKFEGVDATWSGSKAILTFPAPVHPTGGPKHVTSGVRITSPTYGWSALAKHDFKIRVSDRIKPSSVLLKRVESKGVSQVISTQNGLREVQGTFATARHPLYQAYTPHSSKQSACSGNANNGLLIPLNSRPMAYANVVAPMASVVEFAPQIHGFGYRVFSYAGGAPLDATPIFNSNFDYPHGQIGEELIHVGYTRASGNEIERHFRHFPVCDDFATLSGSNLNVSRQTVRFLEVPVFDVATATAGPLWQDADLQFRVVYLTGSTGGGSGKLEIEFEGPCCESFDTSEDEVCE